MAGKYKPVRLLPFDLKNIDDFVVKQHPLLFPESKEYPEYWEEQAKYVVEGKWGLDNDEKNEGGWRWIPGNLYFYVNMTVIKDEDDDGTEITTRPKLRDVEWYLFYALAACDGFSGFEDDDVYTCSRIAELIHNNQPLLERDKIKLSKIAHRLYDSKGNLKKYKEAREYLYEYRDKPLGKALYDNEALNMVLLSSRGIGKDNKWDTVVRTEYGNKLIKDVHVGDKIYGADGKLTTIIDRADYNNQMQYEVTFEDGRKTYCGDGHLWEIYKVGGSGEQSYVLPLKELRKNYLGYEGKVGDTKRIVGKKDSKYYVKQTSPIDYPEKDLKIDPYFLGLWIGDGDSDRPAICSEDIEIKDYVKSYGESIGLNIKYINSTPDTNPNFEHIYLWKHKQDKYNILTQSLKSYGLIKNKHIPEDYKYSSIEQRMELIRGIMDTDGSVGANGGIQLTQKNKLIIDGVSEVLHSLGIKHHITEKVLNFFNREKLDEPKLYYRININTGKDIFKLPRKLERVIKDEDVKSRSTKRTRYFNAIRSIVPTKVEPSVCLGLDNEDKLFVCDDYIVTHNSHSMSGGVIEYDFVTNGARNVTQFLNNETSSTIVVGSEDSKKSTELLKKFSDAYEYLRTDIGGYFKDGFSVNGCFWRTYEGSLSSGTNKPFTNRVSLKGGKGEEGPGSQIVHVSYKSNPQAGVGYRARRMIVEEAGLLVSFFETHAENSATQKRKTKFGYTVYIGTGGSIKKIKEIREAFYNPRDYQVLPFKDIFNGTDKELGLFVPCYYRNDIYRNELGNTNYVAAFDDEMLIREDMKRGGSAAYEGHIISYPIVPQEMFLNNAGNIYPTDALEERLHELESGAWKPNFGELQYTDSTKTRCYWVEDTEKRLPYIKRWGEEKKMRDLKTGFTMYEPPAINLPQPSYNRPMYIVLYDLIHKEGENVGSSLAVAFVFKFWDLMNPDKIQFNIVAEWIGRFPNMEDNHEQALKLATFYNAKVLPEFNGDFVRYCRTSSRLHMLQPRPGLAIDGILKQKDNNDFGVYISPGMIPDMELYSLEVLDKPTNKVETLEGNLYVERFIRMVHNLTSMRLTEELLYYDRDGNFDYVSAFLLLGLVIRQLDIKPAQRHDENKVKTKLESVKTYLRNKDMMQTHVADTAFNY